MPTPTIIETDLREVLAEMNKKLDTISKDVNQVQIRLATVETKVDNIEKRLDSIDKRFDKMELQIENNQSKQVWALIGILFTAVVATCIRFVLTALQTQASIIYEQNALSTTIKFVGLRSLTQPTDYLKTRFC